MKRIGLIFAALAIASAGFAQNKCNASDPLFKFDNQGTAKEVHTLGTNPEFPFLRNLSTPQQIAAAIKKQDQMNTKAADHLNNLLMEVGFANGAKDLTAADIRPATIPAGTSGNMGDGTYSSSYTRLETGSPVKAWKVTSPNGCYVYLFAKCGNAFFPESGKSTSTSCITAPVNLISQPQEITLGSNAQNITTTSNVYVYYHKKHHKHRGTVRTISGLNDNNPSIPILLSTTKNFSTLPQTYRVTVNTPDENIKVCPDQPASVTANINVEKTSSFSGFDPRKLNKQYKQVTKKEYKKTAKKMMKIQKKEEKVAALTGVPVNRF